MKKKRRVTLGDRRGLISPFSWMGGNHIVQKDADRGGIGD